MGEGQGARNIGTDMTLNQDIYSALYCSLVKVEYREKTSPNQKLSPSKTYILERPLRESIAQAPSADVTSHVWEDNTLHIDSQSALP